MIINNKLEPSIIAAYIVALIMALLYLLFFFYKQKTIIKQSCKKSFDWFTRKQSLYILALALMLATLSNWVIISIPNKIALFSLISSIKGYIFLILTILGLTFCFALKQKRIRTENLPKLLKVFFLLYYLCYKEFNGVITWKTLNEYPGNYVMSISIILIHTPLFAVLINEIFKSFSRKSLGEV